MKASVPARFAAVIREDAKLLETKFTVRDKMQELTSNNQPKCYELITEVLKTKTQCGAVQKFKRRRSQMKDGFLDPGTRTRPSESSRENFPIETILIDQR
jgi:hypothetical protein